MGADVTRRTARGVVTWLALVWSAEAVTVRATDSPTISAAQRVFYNGQYETAATLAMALESSPTDGLAALELRSTALHLQVRRAIGQGIDKDVALKGCAACPDMLADFFKATAVGQALARARLKTEQTDEALFYLGKFDLNYVWMNVDTLGRKTGWSEYWEARKSLDAALKLNPNHIRARVARAWIDYIVDTKMTRGFRWLLGGGNRKRALATSRDAASAEASFFVHTEALFALWDMQVRERNFKEAVVAARQLVVDFPENQELSKFLARHDGDQ